MKYMKFLPWVIVAVMGLYIAMKAVPPGTKTKEMDLYAFGAIPVQHSGRIQPLDSLSRNTLMILTGGRQEYVVKIDGREETRPAIRWLLDVTASNSRDDSCEVFRIDDPDVRTWLNLRNKPGSYRYSKAEIGGKKLQELDAKRAVLGAKKAEERNQFEESLVTLIHQIDMQDQVGNFVVPGLVPNPDSPTGKWMTLFEINRQIGAASVEQAKAEGEIEFQRDIKENPAKYDEARKNRTPDSFRAWYENERKDLMMEAFRRLTETGRSEHFPQAALLLEILKAYDADNVEKFNQDLAKYYADYVSKMDPSDVSKARSEAWMNHFEPFFLCKVLYIMVMVLACLSWLVPPEVPLGRSAFYLTCLTLGVHTLALILRMFIGSRPPVTNLYSSAVFIGWGCLVLCLIMEVIYKNSLGTFVGSLLGFATMQIAQLLSQGGDTMEMLVAVLDTNFWLATHVTIVTLGYTATFVGGFLGAAYIFAGMFTNALRKDSGRAVYQMTYGTICFATLLSFVGTVLGGIWADQSWGRFWGWDPKENGAVLIVIWNALALHARWAGLVKARGFAVLTVFGNIVTAWSWFGTNQLGIGLHAYGFNKTLADSCAIFWIANSLVMILGMIPLGFWASFGNEPAKTKN
nr:cytochrome c biogenesis protein CcsA [Zavarzinella formosa]